MGLGRIKPKVALATLSDVDLSGPELDKWLLEEDEGEPSPLKEEEDEDEVAKGDLDPAREEDEQAAGPPKKEFGEPKKRSRKPKIATTGQMGRSSTNSGATGAAARESPKDAKKHSLDLAIQAFLEDSMKKRGQRAKARPRASMGGQQTKATTRTTTGRGGSLSGAGGPKKKENAIPKDDNQEQMKQQQSVDVSLGSVPAAYSWRKHTCYLSAGGDILNSPRWTTTLEAERICGKSSQCKGFTYNDAAPGDPSSARDSRPLEIFFKEKFVCGGRGGNWHAVQKLPANLAAHEDDGDDEDDADDDDDDDEDYDDDEDDEDDDEDEESTYSSEGEGEDDDEDL